MKTIFLRGIGVGLVAAVLAACGSATTSAPTPEAAVVEPQATHIVADATVKPIQSSDLVFQTAGTVAEVLVREGDTVAPGAPLARLSATELALEVRAAEAAVAQARASYAQIAAGATEEQIATAAALVAQADASARLVAGSVTPEDVRAAQAQLAQARASLAALDVAGGAPSVAQARAQLAQAEASLQAQRDALSQAKTAAESSVATAAQELVRAQASYAEAASNWSYVQETGNNPTQPTKVNSKGEEIDNEVEIAQREQYYAAFVRAQAAMRQAEEAVAQAQVRAEQARKAELTGIQQAVAQAASAQVALDQLLAGGAEAARAAARAQVASAQAQLAKLTGERRAAEVAAAQASLESAQAELARLRAPAREVDLAVAQAGIAAAEVRLEQARAQLEKATLRAPYAGVVAEVNLDAGEETRAAGAAVVLGDLSAWAIETDDLTERDVVRLVEGSPAEITFDALPDVRLSGTVSHIQPIGKDRFGDMTYAVTVTPSSWDARLRWNMSATVRIAVTP